MIYLYIGIGLLILFFMFSNRTNATHVQKLLRQSARFATAAQQDESPMVAVLHANYAAAYLWALKDIASPSEINRCTGVDLKKFEEHIVNIQDMIGKKVIKKCPEFAGEVDLYLATIAGYD